MSSLFTTNIGLEQPATGDYPDTWAAPVNADWGRVDQAMGSSTSISFASSNVTLTVAQAAYYQIVCTGTLSGNVDLILPATIGGGRQIFNQCTGAFTLTVLNGAGDTGGGVVVGQGFSTPVVLTAGRAYYDNYAAVPPGAPMPFAGATPPPGFLLCYGQVVSQTTYAALFAALGTTWGPASGGNFTLPDFRGRVLAGADNMGGSAANVLTGYAVGTVGGAQAIVLTAPQLPVTAYADTGHTHAVTDPGHTHTLPMTTGNNIQSSVNQFILGGSGLSTNTATTGISLQTGHATITNAGGGGSHSNIQPTAAVNMMIRY